VVTLGDDGVRVDCVSQARPGARDQRLPVVARAVEAVVDQPLYAAGKGLKTAAAASVDTATATCERQHPRRVQHHRGERADAGPSEGRRRGSG
jgi:hypothetical protein